MTRKNYEKEGISAREFVEAIGVDPFSSFAVSTASMPIPNHVFPSVLDPCVCIVTHASSDPPFSSDMSDDEITSFLLGDTPCCVIDKSQRCLSGPMHMQIFLDITTALGFLSYTALYHLVGAIATVPDAKVTVFAFIGQAFAPSRWTLPCLYRTYVEAGLSLKRSAHLCMHMLSIGMFTAAPEEVAEFLLSSQTPLKSLHTHFLSVPHASSHKMFTDVFAAIFATKTDGSGDKLKAREYAVREAVSNTMISYKVVGTEYRDISEWVAGMLASVSEVANDEWVFWNNVYAVVSVTDFFHDHKVRVALNCHCPVEKMIAVVFFIVAMQAFGEDSRRVAEGGWVRSEVDEYCAEEFRGGSANDKCVSFCKNLFCSNTIPADRYRLECDTGTGTSLDSHARYILHHFYKHSLIYKPGRAAAIEARRRVDVVKRKAAAPPPPPPPPVHMCTLPSLCFDTNLCSDVLGISTEMGEPEPLCCGLKLDEGHRPPAPDKPSLPRIAVDNRTMVVTLARGPTETARRVCAVEFRARVLGNKPEYAGWFTVALGNSLAMTAVFPERYLRGKSVRHEFCAVYHGPGGVSRASDAVSVDIHIRPEPVNTQPTPSSSSAARTPVRSPGPAEVLRDMLDRKRNPGKRKVPTAQQIATAADKAREAGLPVTDDALVEADAIVAKADAAKEKKKKKGKDRAQPSLLQRGPAPGPQAGPASGPAPGPSRPPSGPPDVPSKDPPVDPEGGPPGGVVRGAGTAAAPDPEECAVCSRPTKGMLMARYPCSHEICFKCAESWLNVTGGETTTCSICRGVAKTYK